MCIAKTSNPATHFQQSGLGLFNPRRIDLSFERNMKLTRS